MSGFVPLVATQICRGIGWTFQSGAETAWITDELGSPEAVEPLIIRRARLQLVAAIGGMALSAGLATLTSVETSIVIFGCVVGAWGLLLAVFMPERGFIRARGSTLARFRRILVAGGRAAFRTRPVFILVGVMVLAGFASEAVDRLNLRRLDQLGLPSRIPKS